MKHFISLDTISKDEILDLLALATKLKSLHKAGKQLDLLKGKTVALIFNKPSTRTRVSFEAGIIQLGGQAIHLSGQDMQLGHGESIEDTAKVLSRYVDAIMIRTFKQSDIEDLARFGSIPLINGLSDLSHPCQLLADLLTIQEEKGLLTGLKIAYVGDGNNMANTLLQACSILDIHLSLATPSDYKPDPVLFKEAKQRINQAEIVWTPDVFAAVADADVVYTDTWVSMGDENEKQERVKAFQAYQVNSDVMAKAKPDAIFLHCLPAYRGEEVTAAVIDGPQSRVFDEAENRLHVQKAVLLKLLASEAL